MRELVCWPQNYRGRHHGSFLKPVEVILREPGADAPLHAMNSLWYSRDFSVLVFCLLIYHVRYVFGRSRTVASQCGQLVISIWNRWEFFMISIMRMWLCTSLHWFEYANKKMLVMWLTVVSCWNVVDSTYVPTSSVCCTASSCHLVWLITV